MRRSILAFDRVLVLLLGLVLVVLGVAAVGWQTGFLGSVWPDVPDEVSVDTGEITGASGFAVLAGVAGSALVVIGLCWLIAHLPRRSVGSLRLPSGEQPGRLVVDPGPAVATAAEVLADDPLIRSARGAVLADRGEQVVRLRATVDPDADLGAVVAACDRVLADLAHVLPADQLRSRVELSVLRRGEVGPRVR
ncbi:hypothetical protein [Cellulomonas xylanilytica]|uniref:Alkaline shock response membrane anchor protein AmaP n=1 Tax=Cellulomonas xylanilytica TaxID=233583 RepID=A0A510V580_9CELL|nr:hypothetical protein [Cellulomonas xylanilytica]GEK22029.1 hypothetical protein CXY01_25490 [Cellulomonas xylanilytica]